ncbi:helix-turn-helix transcriptional regulator [Rhizobium mesoamericanum]|uniref:helix-turn-helix transcriptional regulator n=1 Tax=Rhizobium mesoamericanum TaxID=1079800 RepID=UPI00040C42F9|nr:helix-turn-helix transcriptional regulator [Rhizobium mesoamericanum]
MSTEPDIQHFSTGTVPPGMRFDYWMSILRQSLWPVSEWREIEDFTVDLAEASLGCLTSMTETISAHQSYRSKSDVERSGDRCYLLFANRLPWQVVHNGHNESYLSGDCVLVDSQGELETSAPSGFCGSIIKLPVGWLHSWLAEPELLVGRRIASDSKWGQSLSPIVSQITPEFVLASPLPQGLLVDQVGAMLSLIAGDAEARAMPELLKKIQSCIRERCSESKLTANDVATSINVPPRLLHSALAANSLTFGSLLHDARVDMALDMLTSRLCSKLPVAEIARRAGFGSASHFSQVLRKQTGHTPLELRTLGHGTH